MKPQVTVINTETEFTLVIETDNGERKVSLQGSSYAHPILWTWQGKQWMWLTAYYEGCAPCEQVLEVIA